MVMERRKEPKRMRNEQSVEILEGIERKWIAESVGTLAFLNIMVICYDSITGHGTTLIVIIVGNCIGVAYLTMRYLMHVKRIEIDDTTIIIYSGHSSICSDSCKKYYIVEKMMRTRTLRRYRVLKIINKVTGKKYRIMSDEWKDYEKLRQVLGERIGWFNGEE